MKNDASIMPNLNTGKCFHSTEQALDFNIQNFCFEDQVVKDLSSPKSEMSGTGINMTGNIHFSCK